MNSIHAPAVSIAVVVSWFCTVGLTAAAQAVPLVVLDPGHGGEQSGTTSADGTQEKNIALSVAIEVRSRLMHAGVEVRMTRNEDHDVPLGLRPRMAGRLSADAFVSIHLNHAPDSARRGWETYVLSAEASDTRTQRLLEREQGLTVKVEKEASDIAFILNDLARDLVHQQSVRLAKQIQDSVQGMEGLLPSRGLRQAPFVVLTGHKVPSVLVEMGYLSNADQAMFFSSPTGQREAARILSQGILRFLRAQN